VEMEAAPQLGPAPVRTGGFANMQAASARPLDAPARPPAPAAAGFSELRATGAAKPAHTVLAGSFTDASASPQVSPASDTLTRESGFGAASAAQPGPALILAPIPRRATPLEIQFKPVPEYTEEARRRHIEGEVLLEMLFTATGEVRLLRVVRGLGYGLDEAAVAAAKQVRFVPASHDGLPVDSRAVVHIQFQLAY